MAKAVRRCYKKIAPGEWKVGKYCNAKSATKKYASGKAKKKPNSKKRVALAVFKNKLLNKRESSGNAKARAAAPSRVQALIDAQRQRQPKPRPFIHMVQTGL